MTQNANQSKSWLDITEQIFDFATNVRKSFVEGSDADKKRILQVIGAKHTLRNQRLSIDIHAPLLAISNKLRKEQNKLNSFEPLKTTIKQTKNRAINPAVPNWLGMADVIITEIEELFCLPNKIFFNRLPVCKSIL